MAIMQSKLMPKVAVALLMMFAGCDDSLYSSMGASPPRLSASLLQDEPGLPVYYGRVVINNPRGLDYIGLAASSGAMLSSPGSPPSSIRCSKAAAEQVFEVTAAQGIPRLTVVLGHLDGADAVGTVSETSFLCPGGLGLRVDESVVISVPTAAGLASTLDAGERYLDASADGSVRNLIADDGGTESEKAISEPRFLARPGGNP